MRNLLPAVRRMSARQKAALALLLIAIVVTWVAVCLVLSTYPGW